MNNRKLRLKEEQMGMYLDSKEWTKRKRKLSFLEDGCFLAQDLQIFQCPWRLDFKGNSHESPDMMNKRGQTCQGPKTIKEFGLYPRAMRSLPRFFRK